METNKGLSKPSISDFRRSDDVSRRLFWSAASGKERLVNCRIELKCLCPEGALSCKRMNHYQSISTACKIVQECLIDLQFISMTYLLKYISCQICELFCLLQAPISHLHSRQSLHSALRKLSISHPFLEAEQAARRSITMCKKVSKGGFKCMSPGLMLCPSQSSSLFPFLQSLREGSIALQSCLPSVPCVRESG